MKEVTRSEFEEFMASYKGSGDYIIYGYGTIYTRHPEVFEKHFEKVE